MPEYIEREELINFVKDNTPHFEDVTSMICVEREIREAPTADVVEVKHGEWKEHFDYDCWFYDCPFCYFGFATKIRNEDPPNYCENCGAKMDLREGAEE